MLRIFDVNISGFIPYPPPQILLRPKDRRAEQSCANAEIVTNKHRSKTVPYNIHTIQKKLKHKNINWPKVTAGLSIKLSNNVEGSILTGSVGYKKIGTLLYVRLDEERKWWT